MSDIIMKSGVVVAIIVAYWYSWYYGGDYKLTDKGTVVGIDLGSAYMSVGVYKQKSITVIPNEQGGTRTPTVVSFDDDGVAYIGDSAFFRKVTHPENTIYSVYNLLGKHWDDKTVQHCHSSNMLPYKLVNLNGKPAVLVKVDGDKKLYLPEEICAMFLGYLKGLAENYLGESVTQIVLTVPAYLSNSQRRAVRNAGKIAGLEVTRMLNAPTASVVALSSDIVEQVERERDTYQSAGYTYDQDDVNIIVIDFGASHLDLSVVMVAEGLVQTVATLGDNKISGDAISLNLINYFLKVYKRRSGNDASTNIIAMAKLNLEVERVKRTLSIKETVQLEIESFYKGSEFVATLDRAHFEDMNIKILRGVLPHLEKVMSLSKMLPSMIDQVILTGGSSCIPMFVHTVKGYFKQTVPIVTADRDTTATKGAAIQGGVLMAADGLDNRVTVEISTHSLGFKTIHGNISKVIPRFTSIPKSYVTNFTTSSDYQNTMSIKIYEGESNDTSANTLWGTCDVKGLGSYLKEFPQIEVKFTIDERGLFQFQAEAKSVLMEKFVVTPAVKGMSTVDIKKSSVKVKSILIGIVDKEKKAKYKELIEMNLVCFNIILDMTQSLDKEEKKRLLLKLQEIDKWFTSDEEKLTYELVDKLEEFRMFKDHKKLIWNCMVN